MKTAIITMWMNEEDLAPFFLKHYSFISKIHVLLDADSNDKTRDICKAASNVEIIDFRFTDMFDADKKRYLVNELFDKIKHDYDWIFAVDCDEFAFVTEFNLQSITNANVIRVCFWQIYRHVSEGDLNINMPIREQRRHGDINLNHNLNYMYVKPCIVKGNIPNFVWGIGAHNYEINRNAIDFPHLFQGAHWRMADVNIATKRRLLNKERQSKNNIMAGYQKHDHTITEALIIQECKEHENDPQLF